MGADRWARVQELFEAALACSPDERGALLAAECAGDDALRDEVLSLLAGDADAPSLLDGRALGAFGLPDELRASTARPGDRIGPYRVVREIGRGGMGLVYLAQRADGAFEQDVALKVIKRGMDSREIVAASCSSGRSWRGFSTRTSPASWTAGSRRTAAVLRHGVRGGRADRRDCDRQLAGRGAPALFSRSAGRCSTRTGAWWCTAT